MPAIDGMDSFTGPSFHSARWPQDLDLSGTDFALVGAGASGFQIGPAIAPAVERLTVFQRTAQWIIPNPLYHAAVPAGDEWALRHLPFYGRWYRFIMTFAGIAMGSEPYRINPDYDDPTHRSINAANAKRAAALLASMTSLVPERPDLLDKIVPDYPATGKRILQDDGTWLRTLQRPNVQLVRTAIERIVPDGVVTADGAHYPADIICYATGFRHNDFLASLRVTGRDGISLREQWGDEPTAYLGITDAQLPNLFCVYGPGTNLAAGASLFYHAEFQVHYALELIHETLSSGARWSEVRPDAHDEYVDRYTRRSVRWCGRTPPFSTVITRTARARSLPSPRGRSTCTGSGPARSHVPTTPSGSSAEDEVGHRPHRDEIAVDQHRRGPRFAPGFQVVPDLLERADQRDASTMAVGTAPAASSLRPSR